MRKRRAFEVFTLSFLDCICCGFGAIILLLVLTDVGQPIVIERSEKDLKQQIDALQRQLFELRGLALLGVENGHAALHLAVQHVRLAADLEQLPLQVVDLLLEVLLAALDDHGLAHVGEHQQQDDGAEAAADAVQEGQREDFEFAAFAQCQLVLASLMASRATE